MKKFNFRAILVPAAAALALTFALGVATDANARHNRWDDDSSSSGGRWDDDSSSSGGGGGWDDDSSGGGGGGCRKGCGGGGDPVPEIDPNAARAAAVMLAGGLAVVRYRRGR